MSAPVPMKISKSWESSSWLILPFGSIHLPRTIAKIRIWWKARWILSSESVQAGVVELSKMGSSQLVRLVVEHSNASPRTTMLPTGDKKKNNTFGTTVADSSSKLVFIQRLQNVVYSRGALHSKVAIDSFICLLKIYLLIQLLPGNCTTVSQLKCQLSGNSNYAKSYCTTLAW